MARDNLVFDFVNDKANYSRVHRGKNELIAKAIGLAKGNNKILDLTAGLAIDSVFLFKLGCQVTALERSQEIFNCLIKAHHQAQNEFDKISKATGATLKFVNIDAKDYLKNLPDINHLNTKDMGDIYADSPDVIYYDPMYPETKKSALPRKEIQIFREIVGYDTDQEEVLKLALTKAKSRVVVKRSLRAPPIFEQVSHQLEGKLVRYDVYMRV